MIKAQLLSVVTGFLALFGLNTPDRLTPVTLGKARPARPDVLPLNGQLLDTAAPWTPRPTTPAPETAPAPYGVEVTGPGEAARQAANAAARQAVLAAQPDPATLRAYSGGGGLGESVDQYYTPGAVAQVMWDVLTPHLPPLHDEKHPVRALEPSCGTGVLLAHAPAGLHLTAVEYDPVAARIAAHLHPHAAVYATAFESYATRSSDALFDVAVTNPPYGPRGETRSMHDDKETRSERYMMRHLLRRVRFQTGLVAALLPLSLLHGARHQTWREELLTHATPIHAALVPTGAFKAAGAGVTTALLILRRHDHGVQEALSTLRPDQVTDVLSAFATDPTHRTFLQEFTSGRSLITTDVTADGAATHALRHAHPAFRLAGNLPVRAGQYGQPLLDGPLCTAPHTRDLVADQVTAGLAAAPVTFRTAIETVRDHCGDDAARTAEHAEHAAPLHAIREGTLSSDHRFVFSLGAWAPTDDFSSPAVDGAVHVAQAVQAYLEAATADRPETPARRAQALSLDRAYRAAQVRYDTRRLTRLIDRYPLFAVLLAHLDGRGALRLPEPAPTRLPIQATDLPGIAGELADLMALTEDTLAEYAHVTPDEAAAHLSAHYAFNGERWMDPGLYYAGHAYQKAEQARMLAEQHTGHRRAALTRQADTFLSRVRRTPATDLNLSPRDAVLPVAVLEAWVNAFLGSEASGQAQISVRRENGAVRFLTRGGAGAAGVKARSTFDQLAARALEAYLNHRTEVDQVRGAKDMTREEYNAERAIAIDEAQAYEDRVRAHFRTWLVQSPFVPAVEDAYTIARGSVLRPQGSDRPLTIPGWRGPALHPYQARDVRAMAATTGMVNNYDVGLGKTLTTLALVAYLKACGRAARPIIVVPAGLVSNWATNAALALPDWNVVTVGMSVRRDRLGNKVYKTLPDGQPMLDERGRRIEQWKEDSPAVKRQKIAQLAAGRADLIIMSREAFTAIPMRRGTRERMIRSDPQFQRNLETQDRYETGVPTRGKHQQLVRELGVYGAMLARTKIAREGELSFELLGCDFVAHDEAHGLKNLYAPPSTFGETPRFLGGGGESQRALDALHKGRYVREHGGSTFSFTASWVKNSPVEVLAMLSQVTDALPGYGLATNEALVEQYLRVEPQIVTGMDGSVDVKPCVVGFQRLKELKAIISGHVITRSYGDPEVVTVDGQPLQVPSAVPEEVMIDMTPVQSELYRELRVRARNADARAKGANHPFSILWEMRKLTVDPALKGITDPNARFEAIARLAVENRAQGGKGIVFLSIGEKEGAFERLKATLVQAGYPEAEIAIVSSHTHQSSVDRQNLEDDYNYGHLTLILGTDVLGQGFNLQRGTTLIINADIPWNYEEIRQRVGRGARQGNTAARVRNVYLLMRGSFDTITYTIMSGKKSWLSQLWQDVDELENTGADFNGEMMALLLSDDPDQTRQEILEKKTKLEELTGRAALRRNLEVFSRVLTVRQHLDTIRERASARRHGWTANDHALMTKARDAYARVHRELDLIPDFSFARLLDYAGQLHWVGVLPVHVGMTFLHEGRRVEVTQVTAAAVGVTTGDGGHLPLTYRQVTSGAAFEASVHASHYRAAPLVLHQPTISFPDSAPLHALDARQVNPQPKDPDAVITLSVKGEAVTLHPSADRYTLRSLLITGAVLLHLKVRADGEHLTVTQAAVLSTDPRVVAQTQGLTGNAAFRARVLNLAATAMNAEAIRDRAHAA